MPMSYRVPMSAPDIRAEDIELVTRALASRTLSIGPFLDELEAAFAAYVGTRYAVGVSNGTSGLHLCVRAAGISGGDEVITSAFSFVASANCILYERAVPVFVDVDEATFNLDPARVEAAITDRTRAVLPVHIFGQPCAMHELQAICAAHDLALIEDACEAIGAEYKGRKVGTFGDAAVFAFYPNKQMTMGEGAIVTTDDPVWASVMRMLRNQGRGADGTSAAHEHLGYNYRLDELSAALGLSQLRRIGDLLDRRAAVAARYGELLRGVPGVRPLAARPMGDASELVRLCRPAPVRMRPRSRCCRARATGDSVTQLFHADPPATLLSQAFRDARRRSADHGADCGLDPCAAVSRQSVGRRHPHRRGCARRRGRAWSGLTWR